MTQWEYTWQYQSGSEMAEVLTAFDTTANAFGREGWEMVNVAVRHLETGLVTVIGYYKRPRAAGSS